jgi:hypothetical protein
MHSDMFGGPAPDALAALIHMLASLRDQRGNTTVRGLEANQTWTGADYPADQFRVDANVLDGVDLLGDGRVSVAHRRERVRAGGDGVVHELLHIITPIQVHGLDPRLFGQSDVGTYGSDGWWRRRSVSRATSSPWARRYPGRVLGGQANDQARTQTRDDAERDALRRKYFHPRCRDVHRSRKQPSAASGQRRLPTDSAITAVLGPSGRSMASDRGSCTGRIPRADGARADGVRCRPLEQAQPVQTFRRRTVNGCERGICVSPTQKPRNCWPWRSSSSMSTEFSV